VYIVPNAFNRQFPQTPESDSTTARSYDPARDGPFDAFEQGGGGETVKRQYRDGLRALEAFLSGNSAREPEPAIPALATFGNRLEQGSAYYGARAKVLYGPGKRAFDQVLAHTKNERIPVEIRVSELRELSLGVQVCSEGSLSHLQVAAENMALAAGGVAAHAQRIWTDLMVQAVREFAQQEHGEDNLFAASEIHYVNGYRNYLASRYQLKTQTDVFVPSLGLEQLEQCARYVEKHVTPIRLVRALAEAWLSSVHQSFSQFRHKVLDEEAVDQIYGEYTSEHEARLKVEHGFAATFSDFLVACADPAGSDELRYRILEDPALVMRRVVKVLRVARVLEDAGLKYAYGQKGDPAAIKQIGDDAFIVKTMRQGVKGYRSLEVGDLPSDATREMVWSALDTTPVEKLAGQDARPIQRILDQCDDREWIEAFGGLTVMKFRQASASNERAMIQYADGRCRRLMAQDPQQWPALVDRLLSAQEDQLAFLVLMSTDFTRHPAGSHWPMHFLIREAARFNCPLTIGGMANRKAIQASDLAAGTAEGDSALIIAAGLGHAEAINALVAAGAKVNAKTIFGLTALMNAARKGHVKAVNALITARADVNAKNGQGWAALIIAARHGQLEVVEALIEADADINAKTNEGWTALMGAAHDGHLGVVRRLLEAGADVDAKADGGWTALAVAARHGWLEVVGALIEAHAEFDAKTNDGMTALMVATRNGHYEVVQRLLKAGVDLEAKQNQGWTAVMVAAELGELEVVNALVEAGADVNAKNNDGGTALAIAVEHGHDGVVDALVNAGADVDAKLNDDGWTALMLAAQNGRLEMIEALVAKQVDVHAKRSDGATAMIIAAGQGQLRAVEALVKAGAELDAKDNDGRTALIAASEYGHLDVAIALAKAGADVDAKENSGQTASDVARVVGRTDIVEALRKFRRSLAVLADWWNGRPRN
jgi:ankyrin repeat protein